MYHPEEVAAFRALLAELADVWRLQNPEATDCYTVWDEKTAARDINKVLFYGFRRRHFPTVALISPALRVSILVAMH